MMASNGSGSSGARDGSAAVISPGWTRARTGYCSGCSRYSAIQSTSSWPCLRNAAASIVKRRAALLARVRLRVVDRELLQRRARETERRGFLGSLVDRPAIDGEPLDQPHRGRAIAAGTVDERRFAALRGDRLEKAIG